MDYLPHLSGKQEIILAMLHDGKEMYGLELVEASGGRLKRGTVYVTLGRMEDKGYVESRTEDAQPGAIGLPRRLYRVTGLGRRVYDAWALARERFAVEPAR
jgi:DNA-binding PadR family transcriptional regulator